MLATVTRASARHVRTLYCCRNEKIAYVYIARLAEQMRVYLGEKWQD